MSDETPTLDKLIGHTPLGRILKKDGIAVEFALIRRAFEAQGKVAPDAKKFQQIGQFSGTHLLKLITPRAEIGQHLLRVQRAAGNEATAVIPSTDARLAPVAKIAFRLLEVEGHATRSLVDHILSPDELSPTVTKAFADVFGDDALAALREGLKLTLPAVTTLPAAEFPIIFLPRPGGGDLQVTPIAPAEAYVRFNDVRERYFRKQEGGAPPISKARWHRQLVTTKQQNISSAVGQRRTRFLATMPRLLDRYSAELHRYVHGGRFPRWRDERVVEAVAGYAALLDRSSGRTSDGYDPIKAYSNADIRRGLDERAGRLIEAARAFVDETLGDLEREYPDKKQLENPDLVSVILNRHWPKQDEFDRARRVLSSDHFKGRLEAERG
ncbi:MAG: hypothetical protein B7Y80_05120 [Hyphomicrobium sp. 32-62-53]|nr:MAG: hypothetical protein B7Z29_10855 [Hyphomicrobium sp. 12-62-95]OYY00634.1 MAG: hypothetical protein B7Y80_05120 [Hyphomicrobium sp. 32-62-53]